MADEADDLYGLPLADFVPERNALVKRLRADGRRDEAAAVGKLPKPSVAAWAANQVLRTQPKDARELLAAGDALAAADRTTLREAITAHREILGRLLAAANGLLDPDGRSLSAQTIERVQQTLNAASLDPELRDEATAARLTKERVYSGLGLRAAPAGAAPKPTPQKKPPKKKNDDKAAKAAAEKARRAEEAERKRHAARVKAAEKKLAAAQRAVAAAQAELDELTP